MIQKGKKEVAPHFTGEVEKKAGTTPFRGAGGSREDVLSETSTGEDAVA
jgi:hypothetical protein